MWETQIQPLGGEDTLEKGMATHSSIPEAFLVAQMVKNLPAMQETQLWSPGEGNGNPLQYSCLENSMDGGTWRATLHGVAKS